jgi:hypothetical protein
MRPNRSNYEIWLIDYLDGNLGENQVGQLFSFLKENPDLIQEFEEISGFKIMPDDNSFKKKTLIKKTHSDLSAEQFDFLCIAAIEHDIEEEQKDELAAISDEDPERRKTFELISKIKLKAPGIKFERKSRLRKLTVPQKVFRFSIIAISSAACLAIMISLLNSSGKSNKELLPLVTANSSSNVIKSGSPEQNITPVPYNDGNVPKIKPSGIIVQNTIIPVVAVENEINSNKSAEIEIPPVNQELSPVNISRADFKTDVDLVKGSFSGTLAALNITTIIPVEETEKPGLNTLIARFFREKILKSRDTETGSLKPYELADAGILGLNKLLGWQMSLQKNHDEKGELKSLYFSSKILKFNAPVRKVQL